MKTLVIASSNKHKISELSRLLSGQGFDVRGLQDYPDYESPEETGATFLENAVIKAMALRVHIARNGRETKDLCVLADDSGISCDDLGGAPGVYSARFAGENATDDDNNRKLVAELKKIPGASLKARYVCVLVFVDDAGKAIDVTETCEGKIIFEPRGVNGFGYDPYFFVPEIGKTMAELPPETKNVISHRGKALRRLVALLR